MCAPGNIGHNGDTPLHEFFFWKGVSAAAKHSNCTTSIYDGIFAGGTDSFRMLFYIIKWVLSEPKNKLGANMCVKYVKGGIILTAYLAK